MNPYHILLSSLPLSVFSLSSIVTTSQFKSTWEPKLAAQIHEIFQQSSQRPFMVALVGIPGSGKSVSAELVAEGLREKNVSLLVMPHDGFHYSRAQLSEMENPQDLLYRRGAPDTFDVQALQQCLTKIRSGDVPLIQIPGFEHAVADPEEDAHIFDRGVHELVLCEGLYLLHSEDGWEEIGHEFDFTIFIDSDVDMCVQRLKMRNKAIPGYSPEEIERRVDAVDRVNAMTVCKSMSRAQFVVSTASK
jgi:pantothenate kinase